MEEINFDPIHPGEILQEEFLTPLNMNQRQLALEMGEAPQTINDIVKGKRGITARTAVGFAKVFNTSARFWMNLQTQYDLEVEFHNSGFVESDFETDEDEKSGSFEEQDYAIINSHFPSSIAEQNSIKVDINHKKIEASEVEKISSYIDIVKKAYDYFGLGSDIDINQIELKLGKYFEKHFLLTLQTRNNEYFYEYLGQVKNIAYKNNLIFSFVKIITQYWKTILLTEPTNLPKISTAELLEKTEERIMN